MDQNLMAMLSSLLSGQSKPLSGQQPMQAPRPQMQPMAQPMAQMPMTSQRTPLIQMPMASKERTDNGGPGGYGDTDGNGGGNGGGGGQGDGKGGKGGNGGGDKLSKFERQMRRIANKGPSQYTRPIKQNLSFNKNTIGYGKAEPEAFKTGMADSLASVLSGTPEQAPAAKLPSWI